jgi:hypothetical protein
MAISSAYPATRIGLPVAAELRAAERECCPFLRFELAAEPGMGLNHCTDDRASRHQRLPEINAGLTPVGGNTALLR